uniref:Uncharacterized protein n=1 Tax=Vitis vinifera TaxID=29760 RepID=A5BTC7_VITVI|nr:hypothetical protein VITISV_009129 [Vitis vinifera]
MDMEIDPTEPEAQIKDEDLFRAADSGDSSVFRALSPQQLLRALSLRNEDDRSLLHVATSLGHLEVVKMLSEADPSIGCTPLHRAASTGNSAMCELLIEEGAEVDAIDKAGQTPLMNAVICQNKEVALLLIRHGADVDVEDKEGYTVLGRTSDDFRPILVDAAKAMLEG